MSSPLVAYTAARSTSSSLYRRRDSCYFKCRFRAIWVETRSQVVPPHGPRELKQVSRDAKLFLRSSPSEATH